MTAKEYLQQIRYLRSDMMRAKKMHDELQDVITSIGAVRYDKDLVQTSPVNTLEESVIRLQTMHEKAVAAKAKYFEAYWTISDQIDGIPNPTYREILKQRYMEFKRLDKIAYSMDLAVTTIEHDHPRALRMFEKMYELKRLI